MTNYPQAIKQLKKHFKESDIALAKRLGVTQNSVWSWNSKRSTPKGKNASKIESMLKEAGIKLPQSKSKKIAPPVHNKKSAEAPADINLLREYYMKAAKANNKTDFNIEIESINGRSQSMKIPADKWVDIMVALHKLQKNSDNFG